MSRHRIEAGTLEAAKSLLAGNSGAAQTCLALMHVVHRDPTLLSEEDKKLIKVVESETDDLPIGKLRDNWHPQFLPAKLEQLAQYEATIQENVRGLCERLLNAMEAGAVEVEE